MPPKKRKKKEPAATPHDRYVEIMDRREKLNEGLVDVERQIYALEQKYLQSTSAIGNVIDGWDGYLNARTLENCLFRNVKNARNNERIWTHSSSTGMENCKAHFDKNPLPPPAQMTIPDMRDILGFSPPPDEFAGRKRKRSNVEDGEDEFNSDGESSNYSFEELYSSDSEKKKKKSKKKKKKKDKKKRKKKRKSKKKERRSGTTSNDSD